MTDIGSRDGTLILWMDTETTGLDPASSALLEIGLRYTDADLRPLDDGFSMVVAWDGEPDDFIRGMHGPNGLLRECASMSARPLPEVARLARDYAARRLRPGVRVLAGGSTVRFDRGMLDSLMPGLLDGLSHRSLGVSVLLEACRMWLPGLLDGVPARLTTHRVDGCLDDTLRLAAYLRRVMFGGRVS